VESGYLKQIAASLPQRRGNSLITAAETVFIRLAQRKDVSGPEFAAAREVVVTHFADVNEYNVDWMLNAYGTYLQDSRMVPALKQILASQMTPVLSGERTAALRQLAKLAPRDSRAEVVQEVCGDNPSIIQIFSEIPFATLPETDACLQEKVAVAAKKAAPIEWAAALTARFASAAPYDVLFALYRQNGASWKQASAGLYACLSGALEFATGTSVARSRFAGKRFRARSQHCLRDWKSGVHSRHRVLLAKTADWQFSRTGCAGRVPDV
jgi:hypothetical protein